MKTKIQAAKLATSVGIKTHVMHGKKSENIFEVMKNKNIGTTFLPNKTEKKKKLNLK
jgi:glutamate 5-kinase